MDDVSAVICSPPSLFIWFSCSFPLAPVHSALHAAVPNPSPFSAASLWHGTFRQTEAVLFEQCLLLDGPSFIFTHGAFPVPQQLYTWLHMELKEQAESLSPAKVQQHWAARLLLPCLRSQSKRREYYFCYNQMTRIWTRKVNIGLN